jgi:hypothetical protein
LLHAKRGPAVVELEFDNHDLPGSEEVSGVYELEPDDAPNLGPQDRKRLDAAFAARGGEPADQITLSGASALRRAAAPAVAGRSRESGPTPWLRRAKERLR